MRDNQERENVYNSSYVHEGYLMKIFVGLGIFNRVIFKLRVWLL